MRRATCINYTIADGRSSEWDYYEKDPDTGVETQPPVLFLEMSKREDESRPISFRLVNRSIFDG